MSKEFKIIIVSILVVTFIGFLFFPLIKMEMRNKGSIKNFFGSILEIPLVFFEKNNLELNSIFCKIRGGKIVTNCGITCRKNCVLPAEDNNKTCASKEDCSGLCVAKLPVPTLEIDSKTGKRTLSKTEPVALRDCRLSKTTDDRLGIDPYIVIYECPSSVIIPTICQTDKLGDGEIIWLFDQGKVQLYQKPFGM